jgi:hypothetical protein
MALAQLMATLVCSGGCLSVCTWANETVGTNEHAAAFAAALRPLAVVHMRWCRFVHWLHVPEEQRTPLLARLLEDGDIHWQLTTMVADQFQFCCWAINVRDTPARWVPQSCAVALCCMAWVAAFPNRALEATQPVVCLKQPMHGCPHT